jgi:hypothetical protein
LVQGNPPIVFCCRGIVCEKSVLQVKNSCVREASGIGLA